MKKKRRTDRFPLKASWYLVANGNYISLMNRLKCYDEKYKDVLKQFAGMDIYAYIFTNTLILYYQEPDILSFMMKWMFTE